MAVYPETSEIVTLAEVKAINNIASTDTTYDSYISAVIPTICRAIESYCRRRFVKANWVQWTQRERELLTDNWPINNVIMIGAPYDVALINDTTNNYNFDIVQQTSNNIEIDPKMIVSNTVSFTTTEYLFSTYTSLGSLKAAVEANTTGVTFTYQSSVPSTFTASAINTLTLRATSGKTLYAGLNIFDLTTSNSVGNVYRISDSSDRLLLNPNYAEVSRVLNTGYAGSYSSGWSNIDSGATLDWYQEQDTMVVYNAGYTTANMPKELKWIVASIIQDLMALYDVQGSGVYKGAMKSESLGDYSYELAGLGTNQFGIGDTAGIAGVLNRYHDQLDIFKKKCI